MGLLQGLVDGVHGVHEVCGSGPWQGEGTEDWRVCVEVLRFACAMMAKEYVLGTIKIFVSAVSFYFKMKGWQAPYTNERFQMMMQGIARDIGDRKLKKPPVEARHVAALMGMDRPSEWTLQQWLQGKFMVLWGWQLFNRRQDFGRFQPCDVRFNEHGCQMLIRYAKKRCVRAHEGAVAGGGTRDAWTVPKGSGARVQCHEGM